MKDKTQIKTTTTEILEVWRDYYEKKFKHEDEAIIPQAEELVEDQIEEITSEELEEGLQKIKLG